MSSPTKSWPARRNGSSGRPEDAGRVTYVGHATVLLELAGARVLTDPVLRSHIGPLRRHGDRPAPDVAAGLDAVLISHLHHDHADLPSLRQIDPEVPVFGPPGSRRFLERAGFRSVRELEPGSSARVGDLAIKAVEARHTQGRGILERGSETVGFEIAADRRRIYFAGDTDLFEGMRDLAGDGLDLALLPVWGWGPTLGPGHLDPEGAARAASMLSPRIAIPIHWGTLFPLGLARLRPRHLDSPPRQFARLAARLAPQVEVRILSPGNSTSLSA